MRPSKRFFYDHFKKDISYTEGRKLGADIACAGFKNYRYFKSESYLGVDNRKEIVEKHPVEKSEMAEVFIEIIDITKMDIKSKYDIDFIVSTHTLSHIKSEHRIEVLRNFIDHLQQGGDLLFNIQYNKIQESEIDRLLSESFEKVKKIRYRAGITQLFENLRLDKKKGGYKSANNSLIKLIEGMLYRLERSSILNLKGNMLYYFCQNHKNVK